MYNINTLRANTYKQFCSLLLGKQMEIPLQASFLLFIHIAAENIRKAEKKSVKIAECKVVPLLLPYIVSHM